MKFKGSPITAAVAALALAVGASSSIGGYLEYRSTESHVCNVATKENTQVRSFVADVFSDPRVPAAEKAHLADLTIKYFPVKSC